MLSWALAFLFAALYCAAWSSKGTAGPGLRTDRGFFSLFPVPTPLHSDIREDPQQHHPATPGHGVSVRSPQALHNLNMTPVSAEKLNSEPGDNPGAWSACLPAILVNSSLACIQTDHLGNIQHWNECAELLLSYKSEEACGQPLSKLMPELSLPQPDCSQTPRSNGFNTEVSLQRPDGRVVRVKIDIIPLPATGRVPGGHLFLLQDFTEKMFLEEALLEASEREQRRIGQELHDHLCQHLLGAAFATKALAGALDREQSIHAAKLHDLARLVNDAVTQVRDISRGLHPVELDDAGLMSSLQELANRASHSTPCTFHCEKQVLVKNRNDALNAYRIAQAVVSSAIQQTGAKRIEISLSQSGASIRLEIRDDGKTEGDMTSDSAGIAAKTTQYRARAMNGSLTMIFQPETGTHAVCHFPI